jgi:hypothetical protein
MIDPSNHATLPLRDRQTDHFFYLASNQIVKDLRDGLAILSENQTAAGLESRDGHNLHSLGLQNGESEQHRAATKNLGT